MKRPVEIKALFVLFILLLILVPSTLPHAVRAQQTGGTLHVALTMEPDVFNPFTSNYAVEDIFINLFYDTLYVEALSGVVQPRLATNYTVSPDGTVWTISIVHNATFTDGTPLTSADVQYSFGLAQMSEISRTEIVDNYTIKFYFNAPYFQDYVLRTIFSNYYARILPKHIWTNKAIVSDPYAYDNKNPVSSGPWMLENWAPGQYIQIKNNPSYWNVSARPHLDSVIFDIIPDADTQMMSLMGGSVDQLQSVDPSYVATLINAPNVHISISPQSRNNYVVLNNARYPFDVKQFKHALAYALNPTKLLHSVLFGFGIPGQQGWVTPGDPVFYNPDITQYPYNLTLANQILDNLGWARGPDGIRSTTNGTRLEFVLYAPSTTPTYLRVGQFIADQWAQIGVKIDVVTATTKTIQSHTSKQDFYMALTGWFGLSVQPTMDMQYLFIPGPYSYDHGFNDSELNQLFVQFKLAKSFTEYQNDIFRMQQIISDGLPILTYAFAPAISAYRTDKFVGWIVPPMSNDYYQGTLNTYSLQNLQLLTAAGTMTQSITTTPTAAAMPDYTWAWIVGIVVIAALVIAVVLKRKKPS
jgi:peptide/nickel transport system substrate-binding protein